MNDTSKIITIIDYGMGNLGSISNMIKKIGHKSIITSDLEQIKKSDKLILPGVGAFDKGMENIKEIGLSDLLNEKVLIDKTPILGICLGMQLMTQGSEEGITPGLGWVDAQVNRFVSTKLKIPHMGWNSIKHQKESKLFDEVITDKRFYFVHSYFVCCDNKEDVLTTTTYEDNFISSFEKGNIIGTQFHPEKSHKFGMAIIKNFVEKY